MIYRVIPTEKKHSKRMEWIDDHAVLLGKRFREITEDLLADMIFRRLLWVIEGRAPETRKGFRPS